MDQFIDNALEADFIAPNKNSSCFSSELCIQEMPNTSFSRSDQEKQRGVAQFLLKNGFMECPVVIMNAISTMIVISINNKGLRANEVYAQVSDDTAQVIEAMRSKITYHIKKNYAKVYNAMLENYGCDIGKDFSGNKNFVEKIALIYAVFGK